MPTMQVGFIRVQETSYPCLWLEYFKATQPTEITKHKYHTSWSVTGIIHTIQAETYAVVRAGVFVCRGEPAFSEAAGTGSCAGLDAPAGFLALRIRSPDRVLLRNVVIAPRMSRSGCSESGDSGSLQLGQH